MPRLLIIDSNVDPASPSMRGWIAAFEEIAPLFDEVEVWATQCSLADHPKVKWVPFKVVKPWVLQAFVFKREVRRRMSQRSVWPPEDTVVQVTGFYLLDADIRFIHFSNILFGEEMQKRPETLKPSWVRRLLLKGAVRDEWQVLKKGRTGNWWAVSRKLGQRLHQWDQSKGQLYLTPNSYDPARFNHHNRDQFRDQAREKYGFAAHEKVFVFSAFAHFERKGLLQAVSAIAELRKEGLPLRLLVLGGGGNTVPAFQAKMKEQGIDNDGIVFGGMVTAIEEHLAAADALIFPSHFEAFSLAEIEAAAMGLRLYLTAHYGIEMILDDPENGRLLPWEVSGMVDVIKDDYEAGRLGTFHDEMGEALDPEHYAQHLVAGYRKVLASKEAS